MVDAKEIERFRSSFVTSLKQAASGCQTAEVLSREVPRLLDGAAAEAVVKFVPAATRSRDGIFFSDHVLADRAIDLVVRTLIKGASILDPACGAGDLLLASAKHLPLQGSLSQTIARWTHLIHGFDLHAEFVDATRWRLLLLAIKRHSERGDRIQGRALQPGDFKHIVQSDFLSCTESHAEVVVVNPPYGHSTVPADCSWSSGKTQVAAIFMDHVVRIASPGQQIVAILPDVLRSGSRYQKWRKHIVCSAEIEAPIVYGRFNPKTDVDVFILKIDRLKANSRVQQDWGGQPSSTTKVRALRDLFSVNVGPVVPHRHKGDKGQWHRYLDVSHAPAYGEVRPEHSRRFHGTTHMPPFLTIRRTSNPADTNRVIPTLVLGDEAVAVENHLLVLKPLHGGEKACRIMMEQLAEDRVRVWINQHIRCRHFTTKSLAALPVEEPT